MTYISLKKDYDFSDLFDISSEAALHTLHKVQGNYKQEELMDLIYNSFAYEEGAIPDTDEVNDFLEDTEWVCDKLNIKTKFYIDNLSGEAYEEAISETIIELSSYNKVVDAIRKALPDASDEERRTLYKQVEVAANAECLFFTAEGAIIAD